MSSANSTVEELRPRRGKADGVHFKKPGYVSAAQKQKAPQAVVKVISQARGFRALKLMNYVARLDKEHTQEQGLPLEDENGLQYEGADSVKAIYEEWKKDFERATPGQKRPPRHVTHMIFSGDCEQSPENARAVLAAVSELMQEQLGSAGFRYLLVLHQDTAHPHVHVLVNNYNRDPEKPKLRINPPELMAFRQQFAQKMRERGLEQEATRRVDRPHVLEAISQQLEELRAAGHWYEAKMYRAAIQSQEAGQSQAQATESMLKWARELEEKNGVELKGTDFETVRRYLDTHSTKALGLDAAGQPVAAVDKPNPFDSFEKRRSMARAVARIKADVKATTLPFSAERRQRMEALRKIDAELIKVSAPNYAQLVQDLTIKLGRDIERVQDHIRALHDPETGIKDRKLLRQREASVDKIIARQIRAIQEARIDLLTNRDIGIVEGYKLGQQLKQYEKRLRRIDLAHGFGFHQVAAPGTVKEVEAARAKDRARASLEKTVQRLEQMQPWHVPTPGRDKPHSFDAFAKQRAMAKMVGTMTARLDAAGIAANEPIAQRIDGLRRTHLEAQAPDLGALVGNLTRQLQNARLMADFELRRAAHASTSVKDRAAILARVGKTLGQRLESVTQARRSLNAAPSLSQESRKSLADYLKRQENIIARASQVAADPVAWRRELADLGKQPEFKAPRSFGRFHTTERQQPAQSLTRVPTLQGVPSLAASKPLNVERSTHHDQQHQHREAGTTQRTARALVRYTARSRAQSYGVRFAPGSSAEKGHHLRILSGSDVVRDRRTTRLLLQNHPSAHLENLGPAGYDPLRRDHSGDRREATRAGQLGPSLSGPMNPAAMDQKQLAGFITLAKERLEQAGPWDDLRPFRSAFAEAINGKPAPDREAVDAFAKRRAMLKELEHVRDVVDAAQQPFTEDMRKALAELRALGEATKNAPARDIEGAISRLAQVVTDAQLRIEKMRDVPTKSATEALQRRRDVERIAGRNMQSVTEATKAVREHPSLTPVQRRALLERLRPMEKAMSLYVGKGMGR